MAFYEGIFKKLQEVIIYEDYEILGRSALYLSKGELERLCRISYAADNLLKAKYLGVSNNLAVFRIITKDLNENTYLVTLAMVNQEGNVELLDAPIREFRDSREALTFYLDYNPSEIQDTDIGDLE